MSLGHSLGEVGQGLGMGIHGLGLTTLFTACSQASCSLSHTDHRCSSARGLYPQGLCRPPAPAGAELQGKTLGSVWEWEKGDLCVSYDIFHLQAVAEQIPLLVQGVRGSQAQPDSPSTQLALIAASQSFLQARHPLRTSLT